MVPLIDLKAQYLSIKTEIDSAISEVLSKANFIKGEAVKDFERAFADYIGVKFCLGVGNGTDALEIILKALDLGKGDEVLVPALTWIATAESVNNVGAEPVFVDIDPETYTIDVNKIERKLSKKTRAIIPVHLYGCPAHMDEIISIARKYNLFVIEDCAQAHGAEYSSKKVGTFGIASAFSFFPSKNLGAYGDAGAIMTDDPVLFEKAARISNHGQWKVKHDHVIIGRNSRLDSIQAAILNVKLKHLDNWNQRRIVAATYYIKKLGLCDEIVLPVTVPGSKHVYHLFVIRTKRRDHMIELLNEKNIAWSVHYPRPLPYTAAYNYKLNPNDDYQVSRLVTNEILSLPLYPEIENQQIDLICNQIIENF
jgi:dTDP-4-amino-4,6-dideoxygalactose transaminase